MEQRVFLQYIRYEKRFSEHTIRAYEQDLVQFHDFLKTTYALASAPEVEYLHIRGWILHLLSQKIAQRSIRRKLSALKTYFRLLLREGLIAQNPMLKVTIPKHGKRLPAIVQEQEITLLLDQTKWSADYSEQRNRLLLELLYATGMRRAELISLRLASVDFGRLVLRVSGKGNKERLIPFSNSLGRLLQQYLECRQATFPNPDSDHLLLTDKGKPLYPKLVYNIVHRYLSLVTTAEQRSPHVLRHSFATHLSDQGADLNAIKELLGHASLAATQIYTHNSIEKLRRIYQQAHPKATLNKE